jgi:peptide deformylase
MTIVRILQYPDPRLKTPAEMVGEIDSSVRKIIDDMFDTHYHAESCAALAATQLDFKHPKRITVIDFSPQKDQPLCLINPEIIAAEGEKIDTEACMSVYPDHNIHAQVKRAAKITVRAMDKDGKIFTMEAEGFMAKCIQHELDHLDGMIYLDRLSRLKRTMMDKKIKKVLERLAQTQ